jgi:putative restriction endonuclease
MVNLFIANTDNDWFDFLSAENDLAEVNFWGVGETGFRALQQGELLAFRLKSPRNKIGGFGIFSDYSRLPIQVAWETFGTANGVSSLEGLLSEIGNLQTNIAVGPSTDIGSTILVQPVFFPPHLWFDFPGSWSPSIQRGKRYSTDSSEGLELWERLVETSKQSRTTNIPGLSARAKARFGSPTLITPRLGQGAFRVAVTEAYGRQCAITHGKVLPALDAAHIKPYDAGGDHIKSNGVLLRKDIRSVLDAGYITIRDDYTFAVSRKIRDVFDDGDEYLRLNGVHLRCPERKADWPDTEFLRWHNKERYLG